MTDLAKWLTEEQAQRHVGRAERTLRRWRSRGEVTAYQQGASWIYYDRRSLEECAATQALRYAQRHAGRKPNNL